MPDFRGRTIWSSEDQSFGYIEAGLPNITSGSGLIRWFDWGGVESTSGGAFVVTKYSTAPYWSTGSTKTGGSDCSLKFNASQSNSIYGNSETVQPPSIKVRVKTRFN